MCDLDEDHCTSVLYFNCMSTNMTSTGRYSAAVADGCHAAHHLSVAGHSISNMLSMNYAES